MTGGSGALINGIGTGMAHAISHTTKSTEPIKIANLVFFFMRVNC